MASCPRPEVGGTLERALTSVPFADVVTLRLRPVVARLTADGAGGGIYREVVGQVEQALIALAMERTGGNQQQAARLLGISRNTLRVKRNAAGGDCAAGR